ncbi:MarR family winged helix-turn-helix transcriptional regulator [Leifsonia sp. NPDC058194]|uniref:MarR family winged helix-turn-helix transcriptional regulator n=1 Tax=Leifsonia sp. NPDC058194 TaxID=3346374 RepID=UPI0036DE3E52
MTDETTDDAAAPTDRPAAPTARVLAARWAEAGRDPVSIELVTLLRRAVVATTAGPDRVLEDHGLSRGQFDVLAALHRAPAGDAGITQAQLAQSMMVSPPGMKKRLDGLFERQVISRSVDSADARRLLIRLTPAGRRLVEDFLDAFFDAEHEGVRPLPEADRPRLIGLLRTLAGED